MTFDRLMRIRQWAPIARCPGRYVLQGAPPNLQPRDLVGSEIALREFRVEAARDTVVVAQLIDGGLISYRRADGTYLHTLNTSEGFERKLRQLEIAI